MIGQQDWTPLLRRFDLKKQPDTYAELCGMYARNSVLLQHAHKVCRDEKYHKTAKYEVRGRKIANRMGMLTTIFIQDITLRGQVNILKYSLQVTNPVGQIFKTPKTAEKLENTAYNKAEQIMGITYPTGNQATMAKTSQHSIVTALTNHPSGCSMQHQALFLEFSMNGDDVN